LETNVTNLPTGVITEGLENRKPKIGFMYSFEPAPLVVCKDGKCVRCDNSDVSNSPTCKMRQEDPRFQIFDSKSVIDPQTLSHSTIPSWVDLVRLSPEEFEVMKTRSSDFNDDIDDHYFVTFIFEKWKKWMKIKKKGNSNKCKIGEELQ